MAIPNSMAVPPVFRVQPSRRLRRLAPAGAAAGTRYGGPVLGFLSLCLPIFAVVGLGWAAVRRGTITPAVTDAVGTFAFSFALPAMLLRLMAAQPLAKASSRASSAAISAPAS